MSPHAPPSLADIEAAAARIAPLVVRTPLISNPMLDAACGGRAFVKAECLQRHGSFKLRGATNKIAALAPEQRARGVLAFSSGNHAIATAAAARHFGVSAVIVMPADAPAIKRDRATSFGAEIVAYDRLTEDREAIGHAIAKARGLSLVKPFDDPFVIAGQGTIGLEIAADLDAVDLVLVCTSGGGLVSGIATAVQARRPAAQVYAVEPEGHDDLARSLAAGVRVKNAPGVRSICDALMVEQPGALTFEIMRARLAGSLVVADEAVRAAMRFAMAELKLVLEPGGAIALAALLSGAVDARGKTVVVIASGGNVDLETYRALIGA
jgi:threonine dehydratase